MHRSGLAAFSAFRDEDWKASRFFKLGFCFFDICKTLDRDLVRMNQTRSIIALGLKSFIQIIQYGGA
jgi:hypothetical protein